jgi:histidine triad (HIT) family protein
MAASTILPSCTAVAPDEDAGESAGCLFCAIVAGTAPATVVVENRSCVAFLDTRPLFPGHTLVVPREHHETLADLPARLVEPLFSLAQSLSSAMEEGLGAAGSFVAVNNRVSQSVAHLHVHVVPRNRKDGLRGFFWPRTRYPDDAAMAEVADRLRACVVGSGLAST